MFAHRKPLGKRLAGAKAFAARLAPTNVGTPCAFLTGREKYGLTALGRFRE
jgi:hypothetical protein